MMAIQNVHK